MFAVVAYNADEQKTNVLRVATISTNRKELHSQTQTLINELTSKDVATQST